MHFLVSTPHFLLGYGTDTGRVTVLDSGRGEYYGISWDPSGANLTMTHSLLENDQLKMLSDYAVSALSQGLSSCA